MFASSSFSFLSITKRFLLWLSSFCFCSFSSLLVLLIVLWISISCIISLENIKMLKREKNKYYICLAKIIKNKKTHIFIIKCWGWNSPFHFIPKQLFLNYPTDIEQHYLRLILSWHEQLFRQVYNLWSVKYTSLGC